jgi:hypothetical protein
VVARPQPAVASTCVISEPTKQLLRSLHHPVVIEAYVSQETPNTKAFTTKLESFLKAFADASENVVTRVINPLTTEERERATKAGLKPIDDAGTAVYSGIVVTYGKESDVIPVLVPTNDFGLEFWLVNKIRQTYEKVEGIRHRIGLLVGHDEISLSEANLVPAQMGKPSMREVIVRNFPFVEFVDVDLHGGSVPVNGSIEGLIVTQPARDLEERELRSLDEFVMRGKALVVIASAVNIAPGDATMTATLSTHNLGLLLDGYGIELHRDVVLDFGRAFRVEMMTQTGKTSVRFPQILEVEDDHALQGDARAIDTGFPAFFRMEQIVLPFASSLTLHRDKQPNASMKVVARSTPHAILDTHGTVALGLQAWKPKGEWKQYDVAAYVEGRLQSAFGSQRAASTARVLAIASAQMTANPFARAGNAAPTNTDGEALLQIAGPYADLQRGAVPLLYSIMALVNVLDMIVDGPTLSAVTTQSPCAL